MRGRIPDLVRSGGCPDTPEEAVRQDLLRHLITEVGIPRGCLRCEWPVDRKHSGDRADIVAFAARGIAVVPVLLAECKAPEVPLDANVMDQVRRYLRRCPAPWVLLTNGRELRILEAVETVWRARSRLPVWDVLKNNHLPLRSEGSSNPH